MLDQCEPMASESDLQETSAGAIQEKGEGIGFSDFFRGPIRERETEEERFRG